MAANIIMYRCYYILFIWLLSLLFFVKIGFSIVTSDTLNRLRLFIFIYLKRLEIDIVTLPFLQV